ncbi:hypothetical protein EDB80DRAFT_682697 [Ilyonectria destructans]|nr:hypothetical protein EDB80DRAFT_682697 [Ilyonectria destructans]
MKPVSFLLTFLLSSAMAAPTGSTYTALSVRGESALLDTLKRDVNLSIREEADKAVKSVKAEAGAVQLTAEQEGLFASLASALVNALAPAIVDAITSAIGARDLELHTRGEAVQSEKSEDAFLFPSLSPFPWFKLSPFPKPPPVTWPFTFPLTFPPKTVPKVPTTPVTPPVDTAPGTDAAAPANGAATGAPTKKMSKRLSRRNQAAKAKESEESFWFPWTHPRPITLIPPKTPAVELSIGARGEAVKVGQAVQMTASQEAWLGNVVQTITGIVLPQLVASLNGILSKRDLDAREEELLFPASMFTARSHFGKRDESMSRRDQAMNAMQSQEAQEAWLGNVVQTITGIVLPQIIASLNGVLSK